MNFFFPLAISYSFSSAKGAEKMCLEKGEEFRSRSPTFPKCGTQICFDSENYAYDDGVEAWSKSGWRLAGETEKDFLDERQWAKSRFGFIELDVARRVFPFWCAFTKRRAARPLDRSTQQPNASCIYPTY